MIDIKKVQVFLSKYKSKINIIHSILYIILSLKVVVDSGKGLSFYLLLFLIYTDYAINLTTQSKYTNKQRIARLIVMIIIGIIIGMIFDSYF